MHHNQQKRWWQDSNGSNCPVGRGPRYMICMLDKSKNTQTYQSGMCFVWDSGMSVCFLHAIFTCQCVFLLTQRAKICDKIWYLGPLPTIVVLSRLSLMLTSSMKVCSWAMKVCSWVMPALCTAWPGSGRYLREFIQFSKASEDTHLFSINYAWFSYKNR